MYKLSKSRVPRIMLNAGVESVKHLSELSGVSANSLSRALRGGSVKLATLKALATALNCDPGDLIEEVD